MQRLERRGGAAENDPRAPPRPSPLPLELRAHQRHVARVVPRRRALFVARLVLLVHHDGGEPLDRGEHGGAWPDRHPPLAAP